MNDLFHRLRSAGSFVAGMLVGYCRCSSSAILRCVACNEPVCASHSYLSPNERKAICSWCVSEVAGSDFIDEDDDTIEVEDDEDNIIDVTFKEAR